MQISSSKVISIKCHSNDVIMSAMASQITGVSIVRSTVCADEDKKKYQSSTTMAFVRETISDR